MNSKISDKDKKDWEDFVSNNDDLYDKDSSVKERKIKKIISFDLHGYSLDEANLKMHNLINDAYINEVSKLIIVTGKGIHSENEKDPYVSKDLSILKFSIPEFISQKKRLTNIIYEIKDAKREDGGSGAFYIFLKKRK